MNEADKHSIALRQIRELVETQQFEALAQNAEEQWLASDDVSALVLFAFARARLDDVKGAKDMLPEILSRQGALDVDGIVDLAALHIALGNPNKAKTLLNAVLEQAPQHGLALSRLGYSHWSEGNFTDARTCYERAALLLPRHIPVNLFLVTLLLSDDEFLKAQDAISIVQTNLDEVTNYPPKNIVDRFQHQIHMLQLQIWAATSKNANAEAFLEAYRQDGPEFLYFQLLHCYVRLLADHNTYDQAMDILGNSVERYPDNIGLHTVQAELEKSQGHFLQASKIYRFAITLARQQGKEQILLWTSLSATWLHRNERRARHAAMKAVTQASELKVDEERSFKMIQQLRWQAKASLAWVENADENYETAEELFNEILKENKQNVPALQGLGHQNLQLGKIDAAIEMFERIKTINPAMGFLALVNTRQFPQEKMTLDFIECVIKRPDLDQQNRASFMFHLAAAREHRKEYKRAFECAVKANDVNRKNLNYNARDHRNKCARIRVSFSKSLYEHRSGYGVASNLPIYVLGMPRSGTTLVEQILGSHAQIFGAGELSAIPQVIARLGRKERHLGSGRDYPDSVDDLTLAAVEKIANSVLADLRSKDPKAQHIIDKMPHNFENIGLIKLLFPNVKIISVRRDPRDIAISNYFTDYQAKHGGMGFAFDLREIGQQIADHNLLMHHWNQVFPGEIFDINYEDVIEDMEGSARRMLDYIGVDWDPNVLSFNDLARPIKTASVWQVRQPIYNTSKERWRHYDQYLAPLIEGTNAKIEPDPIHDMITLPEPGLFDEGAELYEKNDLDGAEYILKKLLHHVPGHAAANFLIGSIYFRKGADREGIEMMEKALVVCPWNQNWKHDLIQAYELSGEDEKVAALNKKYRGQKFGDEKSKPAFQPAFSFPSAKVSYTG